MVTTSGQLAMAVLALLLTALLGLLVLPLPFFWE